MLCSWQSIGIERKTWREKGLSGKKGDFVQSLRRQYIIDASNWSAAQRHLDSAASSPSNPAPVVPASSLSDAGAPSTATFWISTQPVSCGGGAKMAGEIGLFDVLIRDEHFRPVPRHNEYNSDYAHSI